MPSIYNSKMNKNAPAAKAEKYKYKGKIYNTMAEYNAAKAADQGGKSDKKRVVGFQEKTGERYKDKPSFYKAKTEKAAEKRDKTRYKTPLGRVFDVKSEYESYKKERIAKGLPY
jgi:hypothetical protein